LTEATGSGIDFGPILMEFGGYLDRYIMYSIPLLFLAGLIGYYPPGNYARIPFKFISSAYLAIMLLLFTDGGHLYVSLGGDSLASLGITSMDMTLDIVAIIYLLSFIAFIKGFLAFTEFTDNRKQYLEDLAEKFNRKEEKRAAKDSEETEAAEAEAVEAEKAEAETAEPETAEADTEEAETEETESVETETTETE
ncbi:MAG: hypothetical protein J6Y18_00780, partial [Candidatus Methanomethylophilaceae archaeon]|nr:hypothetical protein [Candidatus Methanomethylophilaceae archaeon]